MMLQNDDTFQCLAGDAKNRPSKEDFHAENETIEEQEWSTKFLPVERAFFHEYAIVVFF